jgi:hypothetical protein
MKMNKLIAILLVALVGSAFVYGCEQTNVSSFDPESFSAVNFQTDSLSYSFLENSEDSYVQEVPVQIIGDSTNADREFSVEVIEDSLTTAEASDYEIQGGVIPAGSFEGTLFIELYNSEKLQDSEVSLHLRVVDSGNLEAGNEESDDFVMYWTDKVIVPAWTYYSFFFCPNPSTAAYRAIVESTGVTEFTLDDYRELGPTGAEALGREFADYVEEYNANHDEPLTHDDGPQEGQPVQPIY